MRKKNIKSYGLFLFVSVILILYGSTVCFADAESALHISEVMPKNTAFLADAEGVFHDWIEIVNDSDQPIDITGYGLSDKEDKVRWTFPETKIGAHEYLAVDDFGFGISGQGETIYLSDPEQNIIDRFSCPESSDDVSFLRKDGIVCECRYPTPGTPNTPEGYVKFCETEKTASPLVINEVVTASNISEDKTGTECLDWIELKNISNDPVNLSEYSLTDQPTSSEGTGKNSYTLPEKNLEPGERILLYCSDDSEAENYTGFGLDSDYDSIFLYHGNALADYASLKNVPTGGSMGRMDGHHGYFCFSVPSPLTENTDGYRFVSEKPQASVKEGVFATGGFSVELSGSGDVFYTLDGTVPTEESEKYSAPIQINTTTVIRAACKENDSVKSEISTFSYIIDSSTLPVVSLVFDDFREFEGLYNTINNNMLSLKEKELIANISFFDGENGFSIPCGIHMRGYTSLKAPKKSMGVYFRDRYGADELDYDVFENGIKEYSSLLLRVGQDYNFTYIRNELFQELCLEMTDKVSTQEGRYCLLFINGSYWGLYCLKEDFSSQFYASHFHVSKGSVERQKSPVPLDSNFYQEIFLYALSNTLSTEEGYAHICSVLDIDSLIDWIILEGVSGNTDTVHNVSFFRSKELDNKWKLSFYDLDWALWYEQFDFENIINGQGNASFEMTNLIQRLFRNKEFTTKFLERFDEINRTVLSNEHILEKIDELADRIAPEVQRDLERWTDHSEVHWPTLLQRMKDMIINIDWAGHNRKEIILYVDGAKEFFESRMAAESFPEEN